MYREVDGRVATPAIEIGASCVPADTRLLTWDGYKAIVDVKVGDKVLTHEGTYQTVTDCIDNGVKPTFKVTLSNGMELTCTANHPFYTTKGWVRCEDLTEDDVYVYGEKESWKTLAWCSDYKVSSWGRIVGKRGYEVKHLKSKLSGRPCTVDIYTAPYKKVRKSVGRLVCETFNSGDTSLEVRHLDGNSWNNNAENLVFGTSFENTADWKLHGSCGKVDFLSHYCGYHVEFVDVIQQKKERNEEIAAKKAARKAKFAEDNTFKGITRAVDKRMRTIKRK